MMGMIHGSLILGGTTLSEVINWLTRDPDSYAIFGASVYDGDFETWAGKDTLEEFLDIVADSWDLHFEKDNMPRNGGHFVFFKLDSKGKDKWMIEEWDAEDSASFLSDLQALISQYWHQQWTCGYSHLTSEAFYEINWRKYNGS